MQNTVIEFHIVVKLNALIRRIVYPPISQYNPYNQASCSRKTGSKLPPI
jgi:hypothetical protein